MLPLAIRLSAADNVVVARADLLPNTQLAEEGISCRGHIPAGHKVATAPIAKGEPARKYNRSSALPLPISRPAITCTRTTSPWAISRATTPSAPMRGRRG